MRKSKSRATKRRTAKLGATPARRSDHELHIDPRGIVKLTLSERTYRVELTSFALIGRHRLPPARR